MYILNKLPSPWAANEIYGRYFADPMPARETIEAPKLPKGSGIELSVIEL